MISYKEFKSDVSRLRLLIRSLDENLRKVSLHTSIISSLLDDLGNIWSRIDNNGMLSSWITLKEYCEQLHKATNLKREEASLWLNKQDLEILEGDP